MTVLAGSHLVLVSSDVKRISRFFSELFEIEPYFESEGFCEFVLPSRFRIAFFRSEGKAAQYFASSPQRKTAGLGLTVQDVDKVYAKAQKMAGLRCSGPPKDHPWGERSFLLIDLDGNQWELTQTPSTDGMLVNRENEKT